MLYRNLNKLRSDARRVAFGQTIPQRQDSLTDQLEDLRELANRFGLYDAADFLSPHARHEVETEAAIGMQFDSER